jgi:hypothetical protein
MDSRSAGRFRWLVNAPAAAVDGYVRIEWRWLVEGWISVLRTAGMQRTSQRNPARDWFDWLSEVDRLVVIDVTLAGPGALADVLGFVVEPALRLGIDLVVVADAALDELDQARFVEPEFRYAHALERLRWLARSPRAGADGARSSGGPPDGAGRASARSDRGGGRGGAADRARGQPQDGGAGRPRPRIAPPCRAGERDRVCDVQPCRKEGAVRAP